MRRHHPDLVARRHAPAITHLAEELTILANRAYDRLRAALVAEGRATLGRPGARSRRRAGWSASTTSRAGRHRWRARSRRRGRFAEPAGDAARARAAAGRHAAAALGGAGRRGVRVARARDARRTATRTTRRRCSRRRSCVYPRSRPLRSLYYVASALAALTKGEVMLATSQLETALAHHEQCVEAGADPRAPEATRRRPSQEELRRYSGDAAGRAVGIDLGTSNSVVAVIDRDGAPRILTTDGGLDDAAVARVVQPRAARSSASARARGSTTAPI